MVNAFIMFWIRVGSYVFYRIRVTGRRNVPKRGPFVLAGNHVSYLDGPIFCAFSTRATHFMVKEEMFSKFILSWLLPRINAFPVNRDANPRTALKDSLKLLGEGEGVGILPEGRRNPSGDGVARRGMAWLAHQAQVPVIPCAIAGSRGAKLFRTQIKVAYGKPIPPPAPGGKREELAKFTEEVMGEIYALARDIGGDS